MADRPEDRFTTAAEMMRATLDAHACATSVAVSEWVREAGAEFLDKRQKVLAANEESWRRTSLFAPTSGTQRVTGPASTSGMVTAAGQLDSPQSGAFRVGATPLAGVARSLRRSRVLPWIAAVCFAAAGLVGGLLHGGVEPVAAPRAASEVAAVAPSELPQAPSAAVPVTLAPPLTSVQLAATSASSTQFWRTVHVTPPPPSLPVRPPVPLRPSSTAPPTATVGSSTTTSAPARSDCNPPFFFEGTKKIFKPSCL